jgi:glucose/arabinose dehydrogenase
MPEGFEELVLASGLVGPTAIDWAPDGRMFVVEKVGVLKVVTPGSAPAATTVLDISDHVAAYGDRGLLGMAVAHDFAKTGHIYLLYTYETDRTHQDGRKTSRLTRVTVGPDNRVHGKERVILGRDGERPCKRVSNTRDCIPADAPYHVIGTVRAPPDGTLWVGTGESVGYDRHVKESFHAYNPRSFAGKLIHVDARGRGLQGHPYCPRDDNLRHTCTKLYAAGFRNPFRFTVRKGTPIVGDVGLDSREEIDVALPGHNYGWPCYEGMIRTPAYQTFKLCKPRYALEGTPRELSGPLYDYEGRPGSVVAGPVLRGGPWPQQYRGRFFFGDYARSYIHSLDLSDGSVAEFADNVGGPVAVEQSPDGNLAYVDVTVGEVRQITWTPGNKAPIAAVGAEPRYGQVPLVVNFSAAGSVDPEGQALSYHWHFGDGATASGRDVSHVYTTAGNFGVRMTVTDPGGRSAVRLLDVSPGNTPPQVELLAPANESHYRAGQRLVLRARATDAEDGEVPDRSIAWRATLYHRGHRHFLLDGLKGATAGFKIPSDHSADSLFRIVVFASDSGGLQAEQAVVIRPRTTTVRIGSSPRGAPVVFAGTRTAAPLIAEHAVGFETILSAERTFRQDGERYRFKGWSDDVRKRERVVTVPRQGLDVRARYVPAAR